MHHTEVLSLSKYISKSGLNNKREMKMRLHIERGNKEKK